MKYIRTKDSIYKLEMAKEFGIEDLAIKQANTIEELCDEFVVCLKDGDKLLMDGDIRSAKDFFYGYGGLRKTEKVYGAIWTEWGLKYVAKMNEKGGLELL